MNSNKFFSPKKLLFFAAFLFTAVFFISCKNNDTQNFETKQLLGTNEAPPVTTKGSGSVEGNFNSKTKVITLHLSWSLGNPGDTTTMGHIHKGAVGESGPVVIPLLDLPKGSTDQHFNFVSQPITSEQEADLKAGSYYVNIHSNTDPGGELRAQLILK
jgi:hypothetical protein